MLQHQILDIQNFHLIIYVNGKLSRKLKEMNVQSITFGEYHQMTTQNILSHELQNLKENLHDMITAYYIHKIS